MKPHSGLLMLWALALPLSAIAEDVNAPLRFVSEAEMVRLPTVDAEEECVKADQWICCGQRLNWAARADLVALRRTGSDCAVLIQDQSSPPQTLDTSAFDLDYELGWDVALMGQFGCLPEIEVRYLSVDSWTAAASQEMLVAPIQVNTAVPIFLDATGSVEARYGSDLHSTEMNARWHLMDRVALLAGFRYLELDELFRAEVPSDVAFDWQTRNRLWGAQAGAETLLWEHGCLTLEGTAKLGLFGNAAAQDAYLHSGPVTIDSPASCDGTSYLIEAGLTLVYKLTPRLAFRGAYNVLWVGDVALATDQVAVTDFAIESSIDDTGDVLYHGGFVGFEFRR